jgi:hypothetical protein
VIFRLRQRRWISSTFVNVLEFYDAQLRAQGSKLMRSGVGPCVKEQLDFAETTQDVLGEEAIYLSTDIISDSTKVALAATNVWLKETADKQVNSK